MLACRRLCKHTLTETDITIADALLFQFCRRVLRLYGTNALTPNIHLHCHLTSCVRDFGPISSFWLFPFERYNGILGNQPTNNRSVELQLMRRFYNDNRHLHLECESKSWPFAEFFLPVFPLHKNEACMGEPVQISVQPTPGAMSTIGALSADNTVLLQKLYAKLYPQYSQKFLEGQIMIPATKYSHIFWNGKRLTSTLEHNATNPYVVAIPPLYKQQCW